MTSRDATAADLVEDHPSSFRAGSALAEQCLQLELPRALVALLDGRRPLAWIGSGLSRIAAEVGARMSHRVGCPSTVFTPLEYCSSGEAPYTPVLVTYGGGNLDILSASRHVAAQGVRRAVLLAGFHATPCERLLTANGAAIEVVTLPEHVRERRFVAVMPLLATCGLALRLALARGDAQAAADAIHSGSRRAEERRDWLRGRILGIEGWRERRWVVLGGGLTMAAAYAWQALLSEAALADVVVADVKDYSHGRYMSALQRRDMAFLVLSDARCRNLSRTLSKRFEGFFPVIHVELDDGAVGSLWGHLALAGALVEDLCGEAGWSLDAPPRPEIVRTWNNWGHILSRPTADDRGR
jgi:hypothetical protein